MPSEPLDARLALARLQNDGLRGNLSGREIDVSFRQQSGGIGRRDFATHWLHWYPAKMFHRIPSICLDNLNLPEDATVLDPFCGSGTVLLEANIRGLDAIGLDINPLARLISRVKVTPVNPHVLEDQVALLLERAKHSRSRPKPHPVLDSWLSSSARVGLHRLGNAIEEVTDPDCRAFLIVTMTSTVRRLSTADPAVPPLVRLSEARAESAGPRYRKALQHARSVTTALVYSSFLEAAKANIRRMSELHAMQPALGSTRFADRGAHAACTGLISSSIDTIITSPPYCGAQKYVRSMKLELILSGFPESQLRVLDRRTLGTEAVTRSVTGVEDLLTGDEYADGLVREIYRANPVRARMASDYSRYMRHFAEECRRVLRPGGHLLITLGRSTLAGVPFPADRIFHRAGRKVGFDSIATLIDRIPSRGLLTERHSTAGRIDHEYITWLRRPDEA